MYTHSTYPPCNLQLLLLLRSLLQCNPLSSTFSRSSPFFPRTLLVACTKPLEPGGMVPFGLDLDSTRNSNSLGEEGDSERAPTRTWSS